MWWVAIQFNIFVDPKLARLMLVFLIVEHLSMVDLKLQKQEEFGRTKTNMKDNVLLLVR